MTSNVRHIHSDGLSSLIALFPQRTRREADTQAALGEDTAALLADDDQYRDDEAGPILDVAVGPRQREARRRGRQYRRRAGGRTDGRRN